MLGEQGIAADLCGANVPMVVETTLANNIDQICQDFEPEGLTRVTISGPGESPPRPRAPS